MLKNYLINFDRKRFRADHSLHEPLGQSGHANLAGQDEDDGQGEEPGPAVNQEDCPSDYEGCGDDYVRGTQEEQEVPRSTSRIDGADAFRVVGLGRRKSEDGGTRDEQQDLGRALKQAHIIFLPAAKP